jgi:DNA-3-methyladenine glycosylase I
MRASSQSGVIRICAIREADRAAVLRILVHSWGSGEVVTRGRVHPAHAYPGFIAVADDCIVGLLTYRLHGGRCEVVSLDSLWAGRGVGTRLLRTAERAARRAGCREAWLITTNDNLHAIGFYQKRGWLLRRVHQGAVARSRRLKPSIPMVGIDGIPLRDEIEMYKPLQGRKEHR